MHQISFRFFQRGTTPEMEITRTRKEMCVSYFSMRNLCMKFQNPSMHGSCRTDGWTHGQPETNMPCQLPRSWGHNKIEMVQRWAVRWINSNYSTYASVRSMLDYLGWQFLEDRRADARLILFYKIVYNLVTVLSLSTCISITL